jgi:hypothetical protein
MLASRSYTSTEWEKSKSLSPAKHKYGIHFDTGVH